MMLLLEMFAGGMVFLLKEEWLRMLRLLLEEEKDA